MKEIYNRIRNLLPHQRELFLAALKQLGLELPELDNLSSGGSGLSPTMPAENRRYSCTPVQERMYSIWQANPGNTAYNIVNAWKFNQSLDKQVLIQAFDSLIQRHENLRTTFTVENGELRQVIHDPFPAPVSYRSAKDEEEARGIIAGEIKSFDYDQLPLFTILVIALPGQQEIVAGNFSHIILDGVSLSILLSEFISLCKGSALSSPVFQFRDHSEWQRKYLGSSDLEEAALFWEKRFKGHFPLLQLPVDSYAQPIADLQGEEVFIRLDKELSDKITHLCVRYDCTTFSILLSALYILLGRICQQEEIVVAVPFSGRRLPGSESILGMFVNTVALCANPAGHKQGIAFIKEVSELLSESYNYQDYPFERILERLNVARESGRPLLNVLMNSQDEAFPLEATSIGAMPFPLRRNTTTFDLAFFPSGRDGISLTCSYRSGLFKRSTVDLIIDHFVKLLQLMVERPELNLRDYRVVQPFLKDYNRRSSLPAERFVSVAASWSETAALFPDKIAVICGREQLSYKELDSQVNRLAAVIMEKISDPASGDRPPHIAILSGSHMGMVVCMLAAVRANVVFTPLDPSFPPGRLKYIVEDFNATWVLTEHANRELAKKILSQDQQGLIYLDETGKGEGRAYPVTAPEQAAFVLYTSGSSGVPKGVMHRHGSLSFYIASCISSLKIQPTDRLALLTTYAHAVGILDIFSTLTAGGSLYIYPFRDDFKRMPEWLESDQITIYHSVPTIFRQLLAISPANALYGSVRLVILGGEEVRSSDLSLFREHFSPEAEFVNFFGATEVMVVSFHFMSREERAERSSIPIAPAVDGVEIELTDDQGVPVGIFGIGELCFRSRYLSSGYCNLPERTAMSFTLSPMPGTDPSFFKSGDLGRLLPNGCIEYLGRKDRQVKLRGLRIDLSEIEVQLLKFAQVRMAVVDVIRNEKNNAEYLHAFYVSDEPIADKEFRDQLGSMVPSYMVPARFRWLTDLPLTQNGKVDRKELSKYGAMEAISRLPENEMEQLMSGLFHGVLALSEDRVVDIQENFFSLGGHSLKASLLCAQIRTLFNVEISVADVFENPTIRMLTEKVRQTSGGGFPGITRVGRKDHYPLSSAQKRIYFVHHLNEAVTTYNLPSFFSIKGSLHTERLRGAFAELIKRHESLRTSFVKIGSEPFQLIHDDVPFIIEDYSLSNPDDPAEWLSLMNAFIRPFELAKAPLLRVGLVNVSAEEHFLLTDLHHIIADGTSSEIMVDDIAALYAGEPLLPLDIQYKDYAFWHNELMENGSFRRQEKYWTERFTVHPPRLNLAASAVRPAEFTYRGNQFEFVIGKADTGRIKELCLRCGTTPYMAHLAILHILLYKYTGEATIVTGSTSFGRNIAGVERIIGLFVNALVIKNTIDGNDSFLSFMAAVRDTCISAYQHQDYPFDDLVSKIKLRRENSRNPLFDVCISFQNYQKSYGSIDGVDIQRITHHNGTTKFDLLFLIRELEDETVISIEYYTALFDNEYIGRMARGYRKIIDQVLGNPAITLNEVQLVDHFDLKDNFFPEVEFNLL